MIREVDTACGALTPTRHALSASIKEFQKLRMIGLLARWSLPGILVLAGCSDGAREQNLQQAGSLDEHCYYTTTERGARYCETTMIEIMARPGAFDGMNVAIRGWITRHDDVGLMFPFPDYAEHGFLHASIQISRQEMDIHAPQGLRAGWDGLAPQRVTVKGRFLSARGHLTSADAPRLGRIEDVRSISR